MQVRQGMRATTKSMKAYETRNRGIGLGDLVWIVTTFTGARFLVEAWHRRRGTWCGCQSRRRRWNQFRIMSPIGLALERDIIGGFHSGARDAEAPPPHPIPPEALFGPEHFEEVP